MSISKKYQNTKGNYKVTFSLPSDVAPNAKTVQVIGEFNNWDMKKATVMKSSKKEYTATMELKPGHYEFRYLIDGLRWENDFAADNYVSSPFAGINNSVLILDPKAAKSQKKSLAASTTKASGTKRGRKPAAAKADTPVVAKTTAKRGRKPAAAKAEVTTAAQPAKRGRKPAAAKADAPVVVKTTAKRGRKPKQQ